mgnify:CR=1 FL=1
MPFEDDSEDALDFGPSETGGGAATVGYTSSRGQANPYTGQLQTLLTKYLENTEKASTEKQALLDKARERIMARSAGPDQAEIAFRLAAALGKPTRTGGFGETLGNVAEATVGALAEKRRAQQELEDLDLKYRLAGSDVEGEKLKTQVGALSALSKAQPKDRISEIERMQEIVDNPKSSIGAKKTAQDRIKKLTYIKGGGEGGAGGAETAVTARLEIPPAEINVIGDPVTLTWHFTNSAAKPMAFVWEACCRLNGIISWSGGSPPRFAKVASRYRERMPPSIVRSSRQRSSG